ncbi:MAG: hypothetical protein WAU21_09465 [Chitinophagales bacterium]|nr:hypothetical protein [Bacteroidota bacterium]
MLNNPTYKQTLNPENYLELWKYFTDDAAKMKDRLWTIASLFFAAIAAMTGFITTYFLDLTKENLLQGKQLIVISMISISVWGLCLYFKYLIAQYGKHIRNGWNRIDFIRMKIEGLSEIWFLGSEEAIKVESEKSIETSLPKEAIRLIQFSNYIIAGYSLFLILVFIVILAT